MDADNIKGEYRLSNKLSVVTGANGYLGQGIVKHILDRVRLSLHHKCDYFNKYENCEIVLGDICDINHLTEVFEGADTVYHVAGIVDITGDKDDLVWKVNYEGTKNVVEACKKCGVKNLIYVSSVDCIPVGFDNSLITEPDSFNPDLIEGAYGKSKAAATQYVIDSSDESLKCCSVHPSCCIGPNDVHGTNPVCTMISLYDKGLFRVTLNFGGYNFVDVRDVAKGMMAAAEKGRGGESYFLTGERLTVDEFIKTLAKINGKKPPKHAMGKKTIIRLCPVIDLFFKAMKWPQVITTFSMNKICENCNFSYEKAARELGYSPMSAEESLRDTVAWEKENHRK